jgi:threonine/homoserine/homoserine lactone efflux protein
MDLAGLIVFAAVYAVAVASPGPGIAALVARVLAKGSRGLVPFIAGFVLGDLIWFAFAAAGLSVLAQTFQGVFTLIKYLGVAYLLYLAYKLWTMPVQTLEPGEPRADESGFRLFLGALALTLGNPKVMVFFMALLPTIVDLTALTWTGLFEIGGLIALILSGVLALYGAAAARARRLFTTRRALRVMHRVTGATMAGAAAAIATRSP